MVDFFNSVRSYIRGFFNEVGVCLILKDVGKMGLKFVKGNVIIVILIIGVIEMFGVGLKIVENYVKY